MTPPPPPDHPPPTGVRRPTQPVVPKAPPAEVPDWVREKLAEVERFFRDLRGEHMALSARVNEALVTIRDDIRGIREQMADERKERRRQEGEVRDELHDADDRLDALSAGQAAQAAEVRAVREQIAQVVDEQRRQGGQLNEVLEALRRREAVEADRQSGGQAPLPSLPSLHPMTSTGQARRAAVLGGGGVTAASLLAWAAQLGSLPQPLQWALGVVAVVIGLGAAIIAFRWGWRAAGR